MDEPLGYTFRTDGIYTVRLSPIRDPIRPRWRVDGYYKGNRKDTLACANFRDKGDAETCAAGLWKDYATGLHRKPEGPPLTMADLVRLFAARTTTKRGRELSPATQRAYRSQLLSLVKIAGDLPPEHLTSHHVQAAVNVPKSPRSKDSYLRSIKALVKWATSKEWLSHNVTVAVQVDPGPALMRPYLQPEQVNTYLAACSPSHRIRSGLILETGLRAGEAVHLRWSWIRNNGTDRPAIRVPAQDPESSFRSKARRMRVIPLSARAQEWLEKAKQRWGNDGFVLHNCKTPPLTSNWRRDTHRDCVKAGIAPIDTHGLRRTAGVLWLAAGLNIYTISRLLGHASVTTTEKAYLAVADSSFTSIFEALDLRAGLPVGKAA